MVLLTSLWQFLLTQLVWRFSTWQHDYPDPPVWHFLHLTTWFSWPTCGSFSGTPTKRQVTKRQVSKRLVSKRPVSKRPVSKRQAYKTSGLQNVRFQNVWFQNVQFLNLLYFFNKKYRNYQVCIPMSFLLITSDYGDIWQNPSKIENKTQPSLFLQTWLQHNLRISTNHKYRIFMDFILQPDVLKTWRFVNLTFCKPDVL